jgi:hypothetical protein
MVWLAAVATFLTGCGGSSGTTERGLDVPDVERTLQHQFALDTSLPVLRVRCPPRIPEVTGHRVFCEVYFSTEEHARAAVTPTDSNGSYTYRLTTLVAGSLEHIIATDLAKHGLNVTARCPQGTPARAGRELFCIVSLPSGGTRRVHVVVLDDSNTIRYDDEYLYPLGRRPR